MKRWTREEVKLAAERIFGRVCDIEPFYWATVDAGTFANNNPGHWLVNQASASWTAKGIDVPIAFFGDVLVSAVDGHVNEIELFGPDASDGSVSLHARYSQAAPWQWFNLLVIGYKCPNTKTCLVFSGWVIRLVR
jgi:hypothetical protein